MGKSETKTDKGSLIICDNCKSSDVANFIKEKATITMDEYIKGMKSRTNEPRTTTMVLFCNACKLRREYTIPY